eukprot:2653151-Pyramimonas_sp.AAC.1
MARARRCPEGGRKETQKIGAQASEAAPRKENECPPGYIYITQKTRWPTRWPTHCGTCDYSKNARNICREHARNLRATRDNARALKHRQT